MVAGLVAILVLIWAGPHWENASTQTALQEGTDNARVAFTRGSHRDDVLRLQGTPNTTTRSDALGREVWMYGLSSVQISTRDGRVTRWSNRDRSLKVR
ncbi:MAG: hypothetical protein OXN89_14165 [Bryobacterales bacterium]|nr:hypothetical protein [Bryobacterales bacterium]